MVGRASIPYITYKDIKMTNQWGFTNKQSDYDRICTFRDAAVNDGWSIKPTYGTESVDRASSLKKDGFVMMIITRETPHKWKYEANISIWGPDGLGIPSPYSYDFDKISKSLTTCPVCKAENVETQRFSFAGRCCADCRPKMAAKHEQGNWTA